jgi:hypothetical protein
MALAVFVSVESTVMRPDIAVGLEFVLNVDDSWGDT